ncbi:portal protein [Massilia varians]|uniref:portal protein n=1 Tax=Massilia varians TaxID=457921 RepID=UPI002553180E|nr:portal protein [Massilia varians]MDK6077930.1 portal protein [Massilia varians]
MSRPSTEQRLAAKHEFFRSDFDKIQTAVRDVRVQCLSDRRFYSIPGAQWEGAVGEAFVNKPRFEFNKTHLAVLRVVNEYRNNRITVDFVPKDGTQADELADACDGLYRADEQDSGAQEAYDNTFEEGTSGGMGAIRLRARYENDEDDEDTRQRIAIEPIYEADTCVFFSLDGKRYDKADAKRCYVLSDMSPADYKEEWGDDQVSWPKDITRSQFDWYTPDVVWIAEVYEVEEKTELVHFFQGISLGDDEPNIMEVRDQELQDDPDKLAQLQATGFQKVREKRRKVRRIHKYIMNGARILSDEGYIAGKCIPIVPFYGKRWFVDGIERCQGHVRLARDAQVLDNMIKSWLAEMAMRFDIEKPIVTPEMIAGHAEMWAQDVVEKFPYLVLNSITDPVTGQPSLPVLQYTKAPNLPPAMAALAQLAATALEDMLGNQQAGEQLQPNQSGKAVELIQQRLDMQTFIYLDNFKKTVKRMGEVWQSMASELLHEPGRKMKTIDQADQTGTIELLKPMVNKETGETYKAYDLSKAKFDVVPDVGPSSSSRRAATVRSLINVLQMTTDPEAQAVLLAMIMMNMEGEGMADVRAFYRRKLVTMGVIPPTEEEKEELAAAQANQPEDPNALFLQASAKKALADAQKTLKDGNLVDAKVAQAHADTIATLAGIEQGREQHAVDLAQRFAAAAAPAAPQLPTLPGIEQ